MIEPYEERRVVIADAAVFAAMAHHGQVRHGQGGTPYIEHPLRVMRRIGEAACRRGVVASEATLIAALLHDVPEDTPATIEQIRDRFGGTVAMLVAELTDDPSWQRGERKPLQAKRMETADVRACIVKLADQTDNVADLRRSNLQPGRIERYLEGSMLVASAAAEAIEARANLAWQGEVGEELFERFCIEHASTADWHGMREAG